MKTARRLGVSLPSILFLSLSASAARAEAPPDFAEPTIVHVGEQFLIHEHYTRSHANYLLPVNELGVPGARIQPAEPVLSIADGPTIALGLLAKQSETDMAAAVGPFTIATIEASGRITKTNIEVPCAGKIARGIDGWLYAGVCDGKMHRRFIDDRLHARELTAPTASTGAVYAATMVGDHAFTFTQTGDHSECRDLAADGTDVIRDLPSPTALVGGVSEGYFIPKKKGRTMSISTLAGDVEPRTIATIDSWMDDNAIALSRDEVGTFVAHGDPAMENNNYTSIFEFRDPNGKVVSSGRVAGVRFFLGGACNSRGCAAVNGYYPGVLFASRNGSSCSVSNLPPREGEPAITVRARCEATPSAVVPPVRSEAEGGLPTQPGYQRSGCTMAGPNSSTVTISWLPAVAIAALIGIVLRRRAGRAREAR
ncbi:MAG: hypothetical protein U0174_08005 [Polyangiaceae bacterium]